MSNSVPTLADVREHIEQRIRARRASRSDLDTTDVAWAIDSAVEGELTEVLAMLKRVESGC